MRKHRNATQDKIFLSFMTAHPGLARGFCRDDKLNQEEKWKELAYLLNQAGPPIKEVSGWKKTWIDWKITIRKKLYRKMNINRTSDGESDDKYELSKIERSINFICDLDNQQGKRDDDTAEFNCETRDPFQSPISSPNLETHTTKKRKPDGLRECFLEALTQNSRDNFNNNVEIKAEKEDDMDELAYDSRYHYQSINPSPSLTTSTAKKRKNDIRIRSFYETMAEDPGDIRDVATKGFVESLQSKLYSISQKLDQLGEKHDKLIELKKEQIEEMRKDREERRRHNLEIEFHNRTLLGLKTKK